MKNLIFAAVLFLTVASCDNKNTVSGGKWESVNPNELSMRPINLLSQQWMALAVKNGNTSNAMTIAWGAIGELWSKPVFIVYVSSDRYTKPMLDTCEYFTVTAFPDDSVSNEGLRFLGTRSGRNYEDKIGACGLTAEYTSLGNIRFAEGNLCMECKKIYNDEFNKGLLPADLRDGMYGRMGLHSFYIGEIVNVWERETGYPEAKNRWDILNRR